MKKIQRIIIFIIFIITICIAFIIYFQNHYHDEEIKENLLKDVKEINIEEEHTKMYIKIKDNILIVSLEKNSSVDALIKKLEEGDITINMEDYSNFEKVGPLGFSLPTNDKQITTEPGDIILYQGNKVTIYYDTNSWNFTKLGHIDNISQDELKKILGKDNVTVTLSLNNV